MASRNSAAVSSSHFTDSLDCASTEQAVTRDTSREQIAARFIDLPPEPPCILVSFHVLKPPFFRLNSETQDDSDLHEEKADHQTEDASNSVGPEQRNGQEWRENRPSTPTLVSHSPTPHPHSPSEHF